MEPQESAPSPEIIPAATPSPLDFAALKATYEQAGETYTILLESGLTVKALAIRDASSVLAVEKHAKNVQAACDNKAMPAALPFLPADPQIIKMCVYLEAFLIEPKVTFVQAMELAKTCGMLVPEIFAGMNQTITYNATSQQSAEVDDAKND